MSENWSRDMSDEEFVEKSKHFYDESRYQMWTLQVALCLFGKVNPENMDYTIGDANNNDEHGLLRPYKFMKKSIQQSERGGVSKTSKFYFPFAEPIPDRNGAEGYQIDPRDFPEWAKKNQNEFGGLTASHLVKAEAAYQLRKYLGNENKPISLRQFRKLTTEQKATYLEREFRRFVAESQINLKSKSATAELLAKDLQDYLEKRHEKAPLSAETLRKKPYIPCWI